MDEDDIIVTERREVKPSSKLAKRFASLVKDGKTPKQAASLMRIDLADPKSFGIRDEVQQLLRGYSMQPEVAKAMVRAGRQKIFIDSLGMGEEGAAAQNYDIALKASNQIASDPDVGLNAPPAPLVSLNFGSLEELLSRIDEKDAYLDVTPEKVPDVEEG